jgi:hypothetical protein
MNVPHPQGGWGFLLLRPHKNYRTLYMYMRSRGYTWEGLSYNSTFNHELNPMEASEKSRYARSQSYDRLYENLKYIYGPLKNKTMYF